MAPDGAFRCEVEHLPQDADGNKVTKVLCHGRLIAENAADLKNVVRPLLEAGGRIVVDLSDVSYLDSSGLGVLVGLKVSAIKQGLCILEFENMTPRVMELLKLSNLTKILSS
jgi:anti-sigma B factor antagonist